MDQTELTEDKGPVSSSYKHGNEPSGYIKGTEFE
jgi:hypothetical protein